MAAKIYAASRERILDIWDYTERTWGEDQADKYIQGLVDAIERIQGKRHLWRTVVDEPTAGLFFIRYQHHFIFFRELSTGTPGVISILHENMDIPSRLKADAELGENE